MDNPKYLIQESPTHEDEVALMLSFVPTFNNDQPPQKLEIEYDDTPELLDAGDSSSKNFFIFLVDRSDSMYGDRIQTTVQALKLFLQSLTPKCLFDIISYGSKYHSLTKDALIYNDETLN